MRRAGILDRYFELHRRGTSVPVEIRGALTTFVTMAYILFANPTILAAAGVPFESAVACTALAAGLASIAMGVAANFPLALASGMGLNAIIAFQATPAAGSWQTAMGLVVLDGLVIFLLVLAGVREAVLDAIPPDLRRAIGAGIGLFVAFIGAVQARLVVVPAGTVAVLARDPVAVLPPVTYGSLATPEAAIALATLTATAWLLTLRVRAALLLGIAGGTALALLGGVTALPSLWRAPSFTAAGQADVLGALRLDLMPLLAAFVLVDFFDTLGTATGIAEQAGLHDAAGRIPGVRRLLVVDSLAAALGGALGVSSVTAYVESAAGVAAGARSGLHSVVVGVLFLAAIPFAPLAGIVPAAATAPALMLVGFLMATQITRIDFSRPESAIPAFLTLVMLPLTYSISHGIGYGFITYVGIQALRGRLRDVHPIMVVLAAAFLGYFIWGRA